MPWFAGAPIFSWYVFFYLVAGCGLIVCVVVLIVNNDQLDRYRPYFSKDPIPFWVPALAAALLGTSAFLLLLQSVAFACTVCCIYPPALRHELEEMAFNFPLGRFTRTHEDKLRDAEARDEEERRGELRPRTRDKDLADGVSLGVNVSDDSGEEEAPSTTAGVPSTQTTPVSFPEPLATAVGNEISPARNESYAVRKDDRAEPDEVDPNQLEVMQSHPIPPTAAPSRARSRPTRSARMPSASPRFHVHGMQRGAAAESSAEEPEPPKNIGESSPSGAFMPRRVTLPSFPTLTRIQNRRQHRAEAVAADDAR